MNPRFTNTLQTLLQLLRKALDNSYQMELPKGVDWTSVLNLASEQGVIGLAAAGIEAVHGEWLMVNGSSHSEAAARPLVACKARKPSEPLIPKVLLLQWIGLKATWGSWHTDITESNILLRDILRRFLC